jgi:hypothetical protein
MLEGLRLELQLVGLELVGVWALEGKVTLISALVEELLL